MYRFLDLYGTLTKDSWEKGMRENNPPLIRLVAENQGELLTFACGLENRSLEKLPASDCELWAIYAHPSKYRQGAGKLLLDQFKRELKQLNQKRLCVWVLKDNQPARAFYESQGGILSPATKEVKIGNQNLTEVACEFDLVTPS